MTAPPRTRRGRAQLDPATSTPPSDTADSTAETRNLDFEKHIVSRVDASIWTALFNGEFRLAVRCRRCQRWVTSDRSRRAHMGPRCAKAGGR